MALRTQDFGAEPRLKGQRPLDWMMFASIHPAVAQMLGLYWLDRTADPAQSYDYLLVADYLNRFQGRPENVLELLQVLSNLEIDGYIVFNKRLVPAPPLAPPKDLRVYVLPGSTVRADAGLEDATNNVGLRWGTGLTAGGVLQPNRAVAYHLWRADLGQLTPTAPPGDGDYQPITTRPVLVARPSLPIGTTIERSSDWPPFAMHAMDSRLPDGWYAYKVCGIDIFGRHSANSTSGTWFQWAPMPAPRPWYYQDPPADCGIHTFAIQVLDKVAPPPPTGVEAFALDPKDPFLQRDNAYNVWFATLSPAEKEGLVGLRVRWEWTWAHMRQAPDTREFRIYYQPGEMNALLGRTVVVSAATGTESDVETDIPNARPAGTYVGTWLRLGSDAFKVVASEAGSPLRLRVESIGPSDDIRPRANEPCAIQIPPVHALFVDYALPVSWEERYRVVGYDEYFTEDLSPAASPLGEELRGAAATVSGLVASLDGAPDLSGIQLAGEHLFLPSDTARSNQTYRIVGVDDSAKTVTLDGAPNTGGASPWAIGWLLRKYEVILPAPSDSSRDGLALSPSLAEPIAHAHVGIWE
jgi:hypothetical protein